MYEVFSIDDLVRIADEIGKPIVYRYSEDKNEIQRFYVLNDMEVYYLDIKGSYKMLKHREPLLPALQHLLQNQNNLSYIEADLVSYNQLLVNLFKDGL